MIWFPVAVALFMGVATIGLWTVLVLNRAVPELAEGLPSIRFHVGAEVLTATFLIASGLWLLLADGPEARLLAVAALGATAYSTVNSPGYYADRGNRLVVAMFAVLLLLALAAIVVLIVA